MKRCKGKISKRSRLLGRKRLTVSALVRKFAVGDVVTIDIQNRYPGSPHPRYRGRSGEIIGTRGDAYIVQVRDGRMVKELIVPSVHLHK